MSGASIKSVASCSGLVSQLCSLNIISSTEGSVAKGSLTPCAGTEPKAFPVTTLKLTGSAHDIAPTALLAKKHRRFIVKPLLGA
jgi:hypothetical protein